MSSFSYSITRQYPYKWFTPTAVVGGIVLTVLFSAINFFSNAYNMIIITTNNPDVVEANHWSGKVPGSLTSKIQPKCEDAIIPIGSTVNTNQTALSYQLVRVQDNPGLTYHNKPLRDCDVTQILIDFQTENGRQAALMDRSGWGVTVSADITCSIPNKQDPYKTLDLRARYDPLSSSAAPGVSTLIRVNASTPAFLWSETLLLAFWTETVTAITTQTSQYSDTEAMVPRYNLSSGYLAFKRPHTDIKSPSFFLAGQYAFFSANATQKALKGSFNSQQNTSYETLTTAGNVTWPNIWTPADRLAKAMFSALSADLGQNDRIIIAADGSPTDWSMVTTPDSLHYWTQNLTQIWEASTIADKKSLLGYGWMQIEQYTNTDAKALVFTPSVLAATYTCSVPRIKSGANVFISVLIADLVLLRAAWSLYNYLVEYFVKTRCVDANLCLGCVQQRREDEAGGDGHFVSDTNKTNGSIAEQVELNSLRKGGETQDRQQSMQGLL